jgi:hypothetical protein
MLGGADEAGLRCCHEEVKTNVNTVKRSEMPPRILVDLAEGHLSAVEIDAVAEAFYAPELHVPPTWMVERACAIGSVAGGDPGLRRVAALAFDSKGQMVLAGARAVALRSRRVLYESGPASLDLEVTGLKGRRDLQVCGHIHARTGENAHEVRFEHPAHHYILSVDRSGEFEVDAMRGGDYAIEVDFGQWVLAVPQISL